MLAEFAAWLADTALSQSVGATLWVVPFVQSLHILAIASVMASAWIIAFRILGWAGHSHSIAQTYARFAPWIWYALGVLLVTGIVLIIGEPTRQLTNNAFLLKAGLLVSVIALTAWLQRSIRRNALDWGQAQSAPPIIKLLALLQLSQWLAIAVAGRWIAYTVHQ